MSLTVLSTVSCRWFTYGKREDVVTGSRHLAPKSLAQKGKAAALYARLEFPPLALVELNRWAG